MTPIEQILKDLLSVRVEGLVKLLIVFGLGIYLVFAVVVIRQVGLMCRTLADERAWGLKLVGWLHLAAAVGVLVAAAVVL